MEIVIYAETTMRDETAHAYKAVGVLRRCGFKKVKIYELPCKENPNQLKLNLPERRMRRFETIGEILERIQML